MKAMFKELLKLLPFATISVVVGWSVAEVAADTKVLIWLSNHIYYVTTALVIPSTFAWKVLKSLQSLVGHESTKANEGEALLIAVNKRATLVWELIIIYVLTAICFVFTRFAVELMPINHVYWILIGSTTLAVISLFSIFRLYAINRDVLFFLTQISIRDKKNKAKREALEELKKTEGFSDDEKAHLKKYSTVITVTEPKDRVRVPTVKQSNKPE